MTDLPEENDNFNEKLEQMIKTITTPMRMNGFFI